MNLCAGLLEGLLSFAPSPPHTIYISYICAAISSYINSCTVSRNDCVFSVSLSSIFDSTLRASISIYFKNTYIYFWHFLAPLSPYGLSAAFFLYSSFFGQNLAMCPPCRETTFLLRNNSPLSYFELLAGNYSILRMSLRSCFSLSFPRRRSNRFHGLLSEAFRSLLLRRLRLRLRLLLRLPRFRGAPRARLLSRCLRRRISRFPSSSWPPSRGPSRRPCST